MGTPIFKISATAAAYAIPKAGSDSKIAAGYIPDLSGTYASVAHTHAASAITSGTLDAARIPDLSATYAAASHNHAASAITSGTLDAARIPSLSSLYLPISGAALAASISLTNAATTRLFEVVNSGATTVLQAPYSLNDTYVRVANLSVAGYAAAVTQFATSAGELNSSSFRGGARTLNLVSNAGLSWSSTTGLGGTADAGLGRSAANVVEVNTGTLGTLGGVAADIVYFGASATDGSWRITKSGNDLVIQRRVTGSWVTKSTIAA